MPSGFLIDSRVLITVFEVPGREGADDIDICATAHQAVKTANFQRKHIVVPLWGGVGASNKPGCRVNPLNLPVGRFAQYKRTL